MLAAGGGVGLAEAIEDEWQECRIDADAAVTHRDFCVGMPLLDPHLDPTAGRREFDGVGEQVGNHLLESIGIAARRADRNVGKLVDFDALGVRGRLDRQDRRVHDLLQVDAANVQARHPGGDPAHVQEIVDDPSLRARIALDDFEPTHDFRRQGLGVQYLRPSHDGAQRIAQLVGERGEKLIFHLPGTLGLFPRLPFQGEEHRSTLLGAAQPSGNDHDQGGRQHEHGQRPRISDAQRRAGSPPAAPGRQYGE